MSTNHSTANFPNTKYDDTVANTDSQITFRITIEKLITIKSTYVLTRFVNTKSGNTGGIDRSNGFGFSHFANELWLRNFAYSHCTKKMSEFNTNIRHSSQ